MRRPVISLLLLCSVLGLTLLTAACGGGDEDSATTAAETAPAAETTPAETTAADSAAAETAESAPAEASGEPIVIGTANSLTSFLAPYELAINAGMEVAADEINAAGGVNGRPIEFVHVDAKSDLNLSATAVLDVIEQGADIVVPICDADFGGPGARAAQERGILAITCAGGPGFGAQAIGPLAFNTYTGSPTEGAILAEWAWNSKGWRAAYLLCDQVGEYTKVMCESFKTRWTELGGEIVGEDTFNQADPSISAQVTRLQNAPEHDFLVLSSFAGGSPAVKEIRAAHDKPIVGGAAFSGTFWLEATPDLSDFYTPAFGSSYGDDPRPEVNEFFEAYKAKTGEAALVDSYPMLGYALVQTIAKGVEIAGTTDGVALGKAIETFVDVPLITGPTTYTADCHVPVGRPMLIIEYQNGQPHSSGEFVTPESVPPYPC